MLIQLLPRQTDMGWTGMPCYSCWWPLQAVEEAFFLAQAASEKVSLPEKLQVAERRRIDHTGLLASSQRTGTPVVSHLSGEFNTKL